MRVVSGGVSCAGADGGGVVGRVGHAVGGGAGAVVAAVAGEAGDVDVPPGHLLSVLVPDGGIAYEVH